MKRASLGLLGLLLACDAPPAPPAPSHPGAPPAAATCTPPYERFGNTEVVWADLDLGRSCTAYLEQDECVLGIWRDCTTPTPREWRGRVTGSRVEMRALHPAGSSLPRKPDCCHGEIVETDDGRRIDFACSSGACTDEIDLVGHTLETGPRVPAGLLSSEGALPGVMKQVRDGHGLLASGDPTRDGVWSLAPLERRLALDSAEAFAIDGAGRPWARSDTRLFGPDGSAHDLPSDTQAMSARATTALVATEGGQIIEYGPGGQLAQMQLTDLPGSVSGLASSAEGEVAILTERPAFVIRVDFEAASELDRHPVPELTGAPGDAAFVDAQLLFTGRCHATSAERRCLFRLAPGASALERSALPEAGSVDLPIRLSAQRWLLASGAGPLYPLLDGSLRPEVRRAIPNDAPVSLTRSADDRILAVHRAEPTMWTVEPSDGTD